MRVQLPECEKWHLEGLIHQNLIFHQSVPLMCMCIENKPCKKRMIQIGKNFAPQNIIRSTDQK